MSEELKPCPFCGGAAKRITLEDADNFGGDVITCSKCDCCTRVLFGEKEGLAESWNTRATHPAPDAEAAGVRPLGYMDKKDIARLQDEITWDGSHLRIGVDHWAQWQEDTPYDHLQAIYTHPATVPAGSVVVQESTLQTIFKYADNPSRQLSPGVGAPGHSHREPGKWDKDGSTCELCAAYDELRALLEVK